MSEFKPMTDLKNLPPFDRALYEHARLKMMVMLNQKTELNESVKKHPISNLVKKELSTLAAIYNNKSIITLLNKKESKKKAPKL